MVIQRSDSNTRGDNAANHCQRRHMVTFIRYHDYSSRRWSNA